MGRSRHFFRPLWNIFSLRRTQSPRLRRRRGNGSWQGLRAGLPLTLEPLEERMVLSASAAVATDLLDYAPGATAQIVGTDFEPNESVTLQVLHDDGLNGGQGHEPWTVQAASDGSFTTTWYVNPDD